MAASAHATGQFCSKFIGCIEQVQSGVLEVTISTINGVGNIYPAGQVLDIPYYVGFAVVAALAWRDRFSLPMIGLSLMAYGFVLELAQELVPTCTFRVKDLVGSRIWSGQGSGRVKDLASDALGVGLGLSWVYLYDLLKGAKQQATTPVRRLSEAPVGSGEAAARALNHGGPEPGDGRAPWQRLR